jgi:hypothetical protein
MLIKSGKLIVAIAACWATGASLYIFSAPVSMHGVTSRSVRGSSTIVETFTKEQSWYEAQGLWGVIVLVVFAAVYLLAVRLAWRGRHVAVTVVSLVAVALSIISGFSIGAIYLPGALGLFVGAIILLSSKVLSNR